MFNNEKFSLAYSRVRKILITGAFVCVGVVVTHANANAQERMHSGRITKSFTEPVERSIAASAEVGIVALSHVKEGDRVKVGDPLAEINKLVLVESLAIAKARAESTARIDAATSQLELIKSQLEAVQSLVKGGHTNRFEVEQKQSEYQGAYAEFRAAEDELKLARLEVRRIQAQIEERIIKSPINGFVTEIHKQLGENVSNNEPEYATVVRVDELKVRFYLDAETLKRTQVGDVCLIRVGKETRQRKAMVTFISPIIDPDSGLGRLDIKIDNNAFELQSGIVCYWEGTQGVKTIAQDPDLLPRSNSKRR